ncbi:hypothetical protein [Aureimonas glaciei]|uniref:Phage DNA packaging protein, Nu1 subunit of terminase n=1 Tax=Aureimonas glaciei TaxID=1776957 RepID=A0A917D947_9HYPH|nr:hypothetical protein [Aureimonas glaciei]GGD11994.1 hypothetical protein GCM10011335_13650 [Aureimonas glaciei]
MQRYDDPDIRRLVGDGPDELVSTDELGSWLGIDARRIGVLVRAGDIPQAARGRFHLRESVAAYCRRLRAGAGRGSTSPEWTAAKTRAAEAGAEKAELANAVARRDLLPAAEVAAQWSGIAHDVRAALLAVPSRLAGLDPEAVRRVDSEIRAALEGLSDE